MILLNDLYVHRHVAQRQLGWEGVVVLGHPHFYHHFGFKSAASLGIRCEYDVPEEALESFMILELTSGSLQERPGTIQYADPFKALG